MAIILDKSLMNSLVSLQNNLAVNKKHYELDRIDDYGSGCHGDSCSNDCDYSCSDDDSCSMR